MIKILHILPRMPIGGVGSFLINTQQHIDDSFQFDYLIIEDVPFSNFKNTVESFGSTVYLLDEKLLLSNSFTIYFRIDKFFSDYGRYYDIVHLHSANVSMLVMPIAKRYGVSVRILHAHATQYSDSKYKSIRNRILEFPLNLFVTNRIACSNKAGDFQFKGKPYDVVYNGIDSARFKYKNNCSDKLIIGHVGNFVAQKNHEYLLKVFKEVLCFRDDAELWLFGKGELEKTVRDYAVKLSINDKVFFWGAVDNIEEYYNSFDVFLLPSLYEGFPVALVEALFCGVPAIVSDTITNEMDITHEISFLPINVESIALWARKCDCISDSGRKERAEAFEKSGLNIVNTTHHLEKLYLSYLSHK